MREEVLLWAAAFWILSAACFFLQLGQVSFFAIVGEKITQRIRADFFRALLRQNIGFFDAPENSPGILASQLSVDAQKIQLTTGQQLGSTLNSLASLLMGIIIAFTASPKIAAVILAAVPLLGFVQWLQMRLSTFVFLPSFEPPQLPHLFSIVLTIFSDGQRQKRSKSLQGLQCSCKRMFIQQQGSSMLYAGEKCVEHVSKMGL